jgi:hypothetical protein
MTTLLFGLFYMGLFGLALAAVAAGILALGALALTRGVTEGRRGLVRDAALLPFLSVLWIGAVALFHLSASLSDNGKDAFGMALPNGYAFSLGQGADKGDVTGPDGKILIVDLRRLQMAGDRVFGTRFLEDQMVRMREWYPKGLAGTHFILDTRTGQEVWLEEKAFEGEVRRLGAALALQPVTGLRQDDAPAPSDTLALAIALGVPFAGLALLARRALRLRRTAAVAPVRPL